jgi:hypothetical protein
MYRDCSTRLSKVGWHGAMALFPRLPIASSVLPARLGSLLILLTPSSAPSAAFLGITRTWLDLVTALTVVVCWEVSTGLPDPSSPRPWERVLIEAQTGGQYQCTGTVLQGCQRSDGMVPWLSSLGFQLPAPSCPLALVHSCYY